LHYAVRAKHVGCINILLGMGANPSISAPKIGTALDVALDAPTRNLIRRHLEQEGKELPSPYEHEEEGASLSTSMPHIQDYSSPEDILLGKSFARTVSLQTIGGSSSRRKEDEKTEVPDKDEQTSEESSSSSSSSSSTNTSTEEKPGRTLQRVRSNSLSSFAKMMNEDSTGRTSRSASVAEDPGDLDADRTSETLGARIEQLKKKVGETSSQPGKDSKTSSAASSPATSANNRRTGARVSAMVEGFEKITADESGALSPVKPRKKSGPISGSGTAIPDAQSSVLSTSPTSPSSGSLANSTTPGDELDERIERLKRETARYTAEQEPAKPVKEDLFSEPQSLGKIKTRSFT
jgi:hypothetical protein